MFVRSLRRGRTLEEHLADRFLLLYLLDDANIGMGVTKIHKLTFLSEVDMNLEGRKGFNFNFVKLDYGPYSQDVKYDINFLVKCGFVKKRIHWLTQKGTMILDNFEEIRDKNTNFLEKIQEVNRVYAHIPRDRLVHLVHQMPNPLRPWMTIEETPERKYLLKRLRFAHQDRVFQLSKSDAESLEIYFDSELFSSLARSLASAKREPAVPLSEVERFV